MKKQVYDTQLADLCSIILLCNETSGPLLLNPNCGRVKGGRGGGHCKKVLGLIAKRTKKDSGVRWLFQLWVLADLHISIYEET